MSTDTPLTLLGGLTSAEFLRDVWQQQPLLIRGAFPDFDNPLTPDELAGLACEDNIEARLVEEQGPDGPWQVSHGPFDEATFARLPEHIFLQSSPADAVTTDSAHLLTADTHVHGSSLLYITTHAGRELKR